MQKYQEWLKFLFGQTIHRILLMSLKRFKGGFSMTLTALVDIYIYPEKSKIECSEVPKYLSFFKDIT